MGKNRDQQGQMGNKGGFQQPQHQQDKGKVNQNQQRPQQQNTTQNPKIPGAPQKPKQEDAWKGK